MKYVKSKLKLALLLFTSIVFLGLIHPAQASILDDIKSILSGNKTKSLTLQSNITHAPNGDLNKNGQFDSGEILKFSYVIDNPTDKEISFATLKTNIPRNHLNFIHDIKGTPSLSDRNKTITIPNLRINPGEKLEISFNARLNYFIDGDKGISTEPEILTSDKKSLIKAGKKEIKAKRFKGKLPSNVQLKTK